MLCLSNLKDQKDDDRLLLLGSEQMFYLCILILVLYIYIYTHKYDVLFVLNDNYIRWHMKSILCLSRTLLFSSLKIPQTAGLVFPSQKDAERVQKEKCCVSTQRYTKYVSMNFILVEVGRSYESFTVHFSALCRRYDTAVENEHLAELMKAVWRLNGLQGYDTTLYNLRSTRNPLGIHSDRCGSHFHFAIRANVLRNFQVMECHCMEMITISGAFESRVSVRGSAMSSCGPCWVLLLAESQSCWNIERTEPFSQALTFRPERCWAQGRCRALWVSLGPLFQNISWNLFEIKKFPCESSQVQRVAFTLNSPPTSQVWRRVKKRGFLETRWYAGRP